MPEFKANFKSVQPDLGGSLPGQLIFGIPGKDGGYYLVAAEQVDANTVRFTFTPSQKEMPKVDPVDIELPGATDERIEEAIKEYLQNNPAIGKPGEPGFSPIANVTQTDDGAVITITDKGGTTEAVITNGKNGYTPKKGIDYDDGKSAYEYAKEGGYTRTETEFSEKLAKEYPEKVSQLVNDSQYINAAGAPVQSINGKTGKVQLGAADVGARPSSWMPTAQEVGALPNTYTPPNQTAAQVGADPKGTAASAVSQHNVDDDSHNDIRLELKAINDKLTAFFDSDNQTLDELSEIVAYITSNKALIDSITTSKVSVADIINNLTTNVSTKPLSAAQGVVLSGLIDTLSKKLANYQPKGDYALRNEIPTVPTKVSAFENDKGYLTQHQDISGKVNKNGLTLGIHTDGLVYVFVDGVPVGNGIEMGVSGDVFGYVDENNNIVVQGNLPDGSYTVKYEMADGSTVEIGDLVLDSNVYYTVTNHLTNCTSSNSATEVIGGEPYSAVISVNSGYELSSVVVTMGGNAVTVTNGVINIAKVTGNIVITAVAEEVQKEPTNLADPTSADWQDGYRLSISSGSTQPLDGHTTTNYIPCKAGDTLKVKGLAFHSTNTGYGDTTDPKIVWYKSDKSKITGSYGTSAPNSGQCYGTQVSVDGDISTYTVAILNDGVQYANSACEWIRIDGFLMDGYTKNDVIITINEEIV